MGPAVGKLIVGGDVEVPPLPLGNGVRDLLIPKIQLCFDEQATRALTAILKQWGRQWRIDSQISCRRSGYKQRPKYHL